MLIQQISAGIQFRLQFYDTNPVNLQQSSSNVPTMLQQPAETLINKGEKYFF